MLPRLFRIAPERCHSLSSRLAVKGVMFAVLASCSFVTRSGYLTALFGRFPAQENLLPVSSALEHYWR